MKPVYLSSFCVRFEDYDLLESLCRGVSPYVAGVELGTSWDKLPDFNERLDRQIPRFQQYPVTIHAPFVEISGAPDSEERRIMDAAFDRAFRWYHEFHATSMVMHTHEKAVDPAQAEAMRENARLAILSVAERAAREGVHLTVENVGYPGRHNVLFDQEQWIALFDQLPDEVGALLDTGHALANGWDLFEEVRRLGIDAYPDIPSAVAARHPDAALVCTAPITHSGIIGHLHNSVYGKDLHRPMFEPGLAYTPEQMDALLGCISENSPDADLILEYVSGPHVNVEQLRSDLARMDRALAQTEKDTPPACPERKQDG